MFEVFIVNDNAVKNIQRSEENCRFDEDLSLEKFLGHFDRISDNKEGFVALKGIASNSEATSLFRKIVGNDKGYILFFRSGRDSLGSKK